jgi:hypothetical protein
VLLQQKAYQRVLAPFDGVVTQRNIDNGSLVQADTAGGIPMFTLMHSDVIRIQIYVPQDQVLGLGAGVAALVRVPELRVSSFAASSPASPAHWFPVRGLCRRKSMCPIPRACSRPEHIARLNFRFPAKPNL